MSVQRLDIWNNWHRDMSLALGDGNPVVDGYISITAAPQESCGCGGHDHGDGCGCGGHDHGDGCGGCGGHDHDHGDSCGCGDDEDGSVLRDALINMLYFAAFRASCGVHVSGLGDDFSLNAQELSTISSEIDFLSFVFGYKTGQLGAEQFAKEISGQTVYYSTLAGENDAGEPSLFACTSGGDTDFYPVFLTEAHLRDFFEACRRPAYAVMQGSFAEFLAMLGSDETLQKLGTVIEPFQSCAVGLPPGTRV